MSERTKISIIIPCFNIEKYIRETLNSIISQNYENLELIVVDGGSTDSTIEIVDEYKDHITHLISESDKGQYDAINKGLSLSTGDVIAWLNADDLYFPWTFSSIDKIFQSNQDILWISGKPAYINFNSSAAKVCSKNGAKIRDLINKGAYRGSYLGYLQQESMFWRKELMEKVGMLSLDYKLAADFEYWIRFSEHAEVFLIDFPVACFRLRDDSRSAVLSADYEKEVDKVLKQYHSKKNFFSSLFESNIFTRHIARLFIFSKVKVVEMDFRTRDIKFISKYRNISNYSLMELFEEALNYFNK